MFTFHYRGLPKVLAEAAAAIEATVTTDAPGCRDAIIPNKTGLLVPPQNPLKLAEAIQWLIEHPHERMNMGRAGREMAQNRFDIKKIVAEHKNLQNCLLEKCFNYIMKYSIRSLLILLLIEEEQVAAIYSENAINEAKEKVYGNFLLIKKIKHF